MRNSKTRSLVGFEPTAYEYTPPLDFVGLGSLHKTQKCYRMLSHAYQDKYKYIPFNQEINFS